MHLTTADYLIIAAVMLSSLGIGALVARRAGKSTSEFFLSGRTMPWWLLGISMVATTFSTDTPNLVTDIVRQDGVSGNWVWWAFLITGMLSAVVYAQLWRRSGVMTDISFYELRYSGRPASALRAIRSLYLGVGFNVLAMAGVTLAAIKIGHVLLGLSPMQTILLGGGATVIFSSLGGFRGVLLTDMILFVIAMVGTVAAAWFALSHPSVQGLDNLLAHEAVADKTSLLPHPDHSAEMPYEALITLMVIPLAVQWWASWYPGAEPGGGGYIAQRMLAAKNEKHAMGATLFFNLLHYAIRPWPWIIVALCSLLVYPDLQSLREAFPSLPENKIGHDLAYPAMLLTVPPGWAGLILASLLAAYMSTISTHLNWGASYVVNDFYKRFMRPQAAESELVWMSRAFTVLLMILSAAVALLLTNSKQLFDIILMFGAGTGLLFLLRWFWWRINAWAEIAAMVGSGVIALTLSATPLGDAIPGMLHLPIAVAATTVFWLLVMWCTKPEKDAILTAFYQQIRPFGPGWNRVRSNHALPQPMDRPQPALICWVASVVVTYGVLFGVGLLILGRLIPAGGFALFAIAGLAVFLRYAPRILETHPPEQTDSIDA